MFLVRIIEVFTLLQIGQPDSSTISFNNQSCYFLSTIKPFARPSFSQWKSVRRVRAVLIHIKDKCWISLNVTPIWISIRFHNASSQFYQLSGSAHNYIWYEFNSPFHSISAIASFIIILRPVFRSIVICCCCCARQFPYRSRDRCLMDREEEVQSFSSLNQTVAAAVGAVAMYSGQKSYL